MQQQDTFSFVSVLPLVLITLGLVFVNYTLAKKKGYSTVRFTLLSFIPLVGWYFTAYLAGAPDLILRERIEAVLRAQVAK